MKKILLLFFIVSISLKAAEAEKGYDARLFYKDKDIEKVEKAIAGGANINAKDRYGYTPLMVAIRDGNIQIAELLIKSGANLYSKSKMGKTALDIAIVNKKPEIVDLIKSKMEKLETDFIKAASEGDTKNLISLIEQGMNINAQDEDGFTALMRAAQGSIDPEQAKRKLEIVEILLKKGANYKLKDNVMKFTALRWAKEFENTQAEDLLKAAGASE